MESQVRRFIAEKHGYGDEYAADLTLLEVRRIVEPRSKIKNEAVVEFKTIPISDFIKSSGYKLEGVTAGIRMEVPTFLRSDFQVLQNLSYKMKLANKEMKRSLKFYDDNHGLMLDIQLQGQEWSRIRPEQARLAARTDPSLRQGPVELTGDMISDVVRGDLSSSDHSAASGSNSVLLGKRGT